MSERSRDGVEDPVGSGEANSVEGSGERAAGEDVTPQQADETKQALRELALDERLDID